MASLWLDQIRTMIMNESGCESEDFWLPSNDSLQLHWKRCCYVVQIWQQAGVNIMDFPDVYGVGMVCS